MKFYMKRSVSVVPGSYLRGGQTYDTADEKLKVTEEQVKELLFKAGHAEEAKEDAVPVEADEVHAPMGATTLASAASDSDVTPPVQNKATASSTAADAAKTDPAPTPAPSPIAFPGTTPIPVASTAPVTSTDKSASTDKPVDGSK